MLIGYAHVSTNAQDLTANATLSGRAWGRQHAIVCAPHVRNVPLSASMEQRTL